MGRQGSDRERERESKGNKETKKTDGVQKEDLHCCIAGIICVFMALWDCDVGIVFTLMKYPPIHSHCGECNCISAEELHADIRHYTHPGYRDYTHTCVDKWYLHTQARVYACLSLLAQTNAYTHEHTHKFHWSLPRNGPLDFARSAD